MKINDTALWSASLLLALLLSPLMTGIINKVKAFFGGRHGPPLLQLYHDIFKLLRKEAICSATSTGLVRLSPIVTFAATLGAILLMPLGFCDSPLGFTGDIILFLYLLGMGRMATVLGALDTGSSFEGMGASRELQFSALAELAMLMAAIFLFILTGQYSLAGMLNTAGTWAWSGSCPSIVLLIMALLIITLAENCRVPFDDPETHLELTMIHEAMVLDHAGPDLALIHYGAALKLWIFSAFLTTAAFPAGYLHAAWSRLAVHIALILAVAVFIGIVESVMARYRFLKVPQMLLTAFCMAAMAVFLLVCGG